MRRLLSERKMIRNSVPGGAHCSDCGKIRYDTRALAKLAARQLHGKGYPRLYPYQHCGGFWHLTSEPRSAAAWHRERRA